MLEAGFALLRLPAGRSLARRIFFGRRSFPDVARQTAAAAVQERDVLLTR
jgi:hypothetical protein